jgi:hypothetical protein
MVSRMPNVLEYCNCVMAGLVVPAIYGFGSLQQRRFDARDKLGQEEAGPGLVI